MKTDIQRAVYWTVYASINYFFPLCYPTCSNILNVLYYFFFRRRCMLDPKFAITEQQKSVLSGITPQQWL